jgi:hypothetical protein
VTKGRAVGARTLCLPERIGGFLDTPELGLSGFQSVAERIGAASLARQGLFRPVEPAVFPIQLLAQGRDLLA